MAEYVYDDGRQEVEVEKAGGGTVGRAYDGTWTIRYRKRGEAFGQPLDARTGTPKTHAEVALIALDFLTPETV